MKTVVAVYTGQGLSGPLRTVFTEILPDCRLINIIDDSLIADVVRNKQVRRRSRGDCCAISKPRRRWARTRS